MYKWAENGVVVEIRDWTGRRGSYGRRMKPAVQRVRIPVAAAVCKSCFSIILFSPNFEMTMPNQEFSPVKSLERLWKRWLWIVAIMILGGAAGWLANHLRPPVMKTPGVAHSSIDYPFAGRFSSGSDGPGFHSVTNIVIDEAVKCAGDEENPALRDIGGRARCGYGFDPHGC